MTEAGPQPRRAAVALLVALLVSAAAALVAREPALTLAPAGPTLLLPSVDRGGPRTLAIEADGPCVVDVAVDGGPSQPLRVGTTPAPVMLPSRPSPGMRMDVRPQPGATCALHPMTLSAGRTPRWPTAVVVLAALAALLATRRRPLRLSAGLALTAAALALAACTARDPLGALPAWSAAARVGLPAGLLAAGLALGLARGERRAYAEGALLAAAVVFGIWVRVAFLPSTGSWDTEYWKAWMLRAATAGITRVYGDPGSTTLASLPAQMSGREPLWMVPAFGRDFTVDYPPLAQALWRWSWALVGRAPLDYAEALSVAVKLPAVLGDAAAALLLLAAFPGEPRRARMLAALYWVLPVSWLPSAVLGYLDGAYAPLLAASVLAARRGRAGWAGAWLALACCVKPTAVVAAPAIAVALTLRPRGVGRAVAAGLAVAGAVLVPFALAGTLGAAIAHCWRILFQGNLSGGYANPWWLLGHALHVAAGASAVAGPVRYAPLDLLPLPARPLGTLAFTCAAALVCARQWRDPTRDPRLPAAALFFAYSMLAIGVHENHPHPLALLLLLTGLGTRTLLVAWAGFSAGYVVNMLALSGLGRFHGLRFAALDPAVRAVEGLRMALGIDVTLLLAAVNLALFAAVLASQRSQPAYNPPTREATAHA